MSYTPGLTTFLLTHYLNTSRRLTQQIIVLPRLTPPQLPSPYLLAAYQRNLPLPLPPSAPSAWTGESVSLTARFDAFEVSSTIKAYIPTPIYRARGSAIPIVLSLTINSVLRHTSSSSSSALVTPSSEIYHNIYQTLKDSISISLEALYAMGNNASSGYHIDTPLHTLPHPSDIDAECIVEHVAASVPLWDSDLAYTAGSGNGDGSAIDEKGNGYGNEKGQRRVRVSRGRENWLQGEIIANANVMPDFVAPNLRLTVSILALSGIPRLVTDRLFAPKS